MATVNKRIAQRAAAEIVGESQALEVVARRVYNNARRRALEHLESGDFYSSIEMSHLPANKHGVRDWEIFTDDEASYHIEVGHFTPDKDAPNATWVEGQNIFQKAVEDLPGKWVKTKRL